MLLATLTNAFEVVRISAAQKIVAARDRAAGLDSQKIGQLNIRKQMNRACINFLDFDNTDLSYVTPRRLLSSYATEDLISNAKASILPPSNIHGVAQIPTILKLAKSDSGKQL